MELKNKNKRAVTNQKALRLFLFRAGGLLLLWWVGYELLLRPYGQPDETLTYLAAWGGKILLQLFTLKVSIAKAAGEISLFFQGNPLIGIARNCNGLAVMALFSGFLIAFPVAAKQKYLPLLLGNLTILLANFIRVAALAAIYLYYPSYLDFNHKYTFTLLMYGLVFGMWYFWLKQVDQKKQTIVHA